MSRPNFIALCGYPEVGKSTVQEILENEFGAMPVDDGRPFREAAKLIYGLTDWQVSTQEGKRSLVTVGGEQIQVRKLLGDLGVYFENKHGTQFKAEVAIRDLKSQYGANIPLCSFGSCRLDQGWVYKREGGVVIEVVREGKDAKYDFDRYDREAIDIVIHNNGTLGDLHQEIMSKLAELFSPRARRPN